MFDNGTKIIFKLSDNIYLGSLSLNKTKILFKSWEDLSDYKIKSECEVFSDLTYSKWDFYMFNLKVFGNKCSNDNFILVNEKDEIKFHFKLNVITEYEALSNLLDLKNTRLTQLKNILNSKVSKYSKFIKYNNQIEKNYYTFLEKNRILNEAIYNRNLVANILDKRDEKYIVPVVWYDMPVKDNKIPNAGRPYRDKYTDWIHHSWDIDTSFWEQVVSLDDWIIIRVVNDWDWSDFLELKYNDLSNKDKIKNLDILRWNQVWLKTMKWDVVFYWHLDDIFTNIEDWTVVTKGQPLWTIWISWVPDKKYDDYHLDFSIQVNPFISNMVWKYDIDDYMNWEWMFKWRSKDYILENQDFVFES